MSLIGRESTVLGQDVGPALRWLISVVDTALIALVLTFLLRLAAADRLTWRRAAPGGIFIALLWQVLQLLSAAYVARMTHETSSMNKTFGLVLGVIGIYLPRGQHRRCSGWSSTWCSPGGSGRGRC